LSAKTPNVTTKKLYMKAATELVQGSAFSLPYVQKIVLQMKSQGLYNELF